MRTDEVNIRDPYILLYEGVYYLYGTRSATCWGEADGFDCYRSRNLEDWEGPIEIFHRPEDFPFDRCFWAPECYFYEGKFYLLTTFGAETIKKGIYVLSADAPEGPFVPYSKRLTPEDWTCIDGTLFFRDGKVYMIFSHSFEDTPDGDMCMVELTGDLKGAVTAPVKLFSAVEAPWAKPVPFAKQEFGMDGDVYFTDGPCVFETEDGTLRMYWSSWSVCGYAVGEAVSATGALEGPWIQREQPVFPENGGHGMAFRNADGTLWYTLHYPNDKYKEHPVFMELTEETDAR